MTDEMRHTLSTAGVDLSTLQELNGVMFFAVAGGKSAVDLWIKLAPQLGRLNHWPLICGEFKEFDRISEQLGFNQTPVAEVLARVPALPPIEALNVSKRERHEQLKEYLRSAGQTDLISAMESDAVDPVLKEPIYASWPSRSPMTDLRITSAYGFNPAAYPRVSFAVIPTANAADAPAYMNFGGFNDCPGPEIHVAFLRDWNRRYGAVPIAITGDVIETFLAEPVSRKEEAWTLAKEFYAYSPDIVDQGTETVEKLAIEIWQSPHWFFWWD